MIGLTSGANDQSARSQKNILMGVPHLALAVDCFKLFELELNDWPIIMEFSEGCVTLGGILSPKAANLVRYDRVAPMEERTTTNIASHRTLCETTESLQRHLATAYKEQTRGYMAMTTHQSIHSRPSHTWRQNDLYVRHQMLCKWPPQ
jgi:hypothetical protein